MASVIIQEESQDSAQIILTQGQYIFRELVKAQLRDYKGECGQVLYFGGFEPNDASEGTFDSMLKVKVQWSEPYATDPKRFHKLMIEILQNIRKTYIGLKSQFTKQAPTFFQSSSMDISQ